MIILFAIWCIMYAIPAVLLHIPYIQQKAKDRAVSELTERLHTPISIGKVEIEWPNRLALSNVCMDDESGREMFRANHLAAAFRVLPLVQGKLVFTTIRLFDFTLHLNKETPQSPLNLQYVIDAFASKDTTKQPANIDLSIHSVMIRKGNFSYDVLSEATTPGKFNAKHINVGNLSGHIELNAFNSDSLDARIKRISLKESSGFELKALSLEVKGNRDSANIRNFVIELPDTRLTIARAGIDFAQMKEAEDILTKAPIHLDIEPSEVYLRNLAPFVPALSNFSDPIEFSAQASGFINDFHLNQLTLRYSDKMLFLGTMSMKGITHPDETYLVGEVNRMFITKDGLLGLIHNFNPQLIIPKPMERLGTINFKGEISGFFDNLVAYGKLTTDIGSIETDILFGSNKEKNIDAYMRGSVSSSELLISELFDIDNPFGIARFNVSIDAKRPTGGDFAGNIIAKVSEFDYKNYRYENLQLNGRFQPNGFDGNLEIDDPNGALTANGMFRYSPKNSVVNLTAQLRHFRPDNLNLWDKLESPEISGSLHADLKGSNIDDMEGSLSIDSLSINTTPSDFFLKQLKITTSGTETDKRLTLTSDLINGEVSGVYSFATLIPGFMTTFKGYVPALINATQKERPAKENNFSLLLTVENTEILSQTLKLPVTLTQPVRIMGHYNNRFNKFRLEVVAPRFAVGKTQVESLYLTCENPLDKISLKLRATNVGNKGLRNFIDLQADAKDNKIESLFHWANNKERRFEASLAASALFTEETDEANKPTGLRTDIHFAESPLIINDSIWSIHDADISLKGGKTDIHHFSLTHDAQYLRINGSVSKNPQDNLQLDLKEIELSYIFDILNIPVLQFGGQATGSFLVSDLFNSKMIQTDDLLVKDFSFNQVELGDLHLKSQYDFIGQGILMNGNIISGDTANTAVNGYVYPVGPNDGLDLHFDADNLNIAFLHTFLDGVVTGLKGRGSGDVHLFGSFSNIDLEGEAYIKDGGFGIEFLNTYYTFSDAIHIEPGLISMKNGHLYDSYGNMGRVNADLRHRYFYDLEFDVDIQAANLLVYNAQEKQSPLLYGTMFGSGTGTIKGNEKLINFDINMQSNPKTTVGINFMGRSTATAYDFITFINKNKPVASDSTEITPKQLQQQDSGPELRMNFTLDVTPDADIELVMDPVGGDKIKGYGSGSLQIEYGTKTDLRMYGTFNILKGNYNFSLQQLIHKDFKIREGSTVSFRGDPYYADLNIDAIYSVTANIGDLDPSLIGESARTNIPVNCVLLIKGMLQQPTVSFDLELPGSNTELERKVKSYINTKDMLTRQIVYLLVLNKFHPSEFGTGTRSNEFSAVTSAAISSQISSILSAITDKVQIGTNIRASQEGFNETEVEMLLSSQLFDNRLLFNGNFGYKNNPNVKNVFVGEFDIEYLLTRTGGFRLKAYNHANDMYRYLKQSLTTQGFGFMYKKDFSSFHDLFGRKPEPVTPTPQPEEGNNP
ncbi:DUF490 domain-containing protein [Bacteroidia bacterium]|nr:DUF490 domain-containing protein [Bacteroidia bacterium]